MIELRIEESSPARSPDASQKQRLDFLRCLYDLTYGSAAASIYSAAASIYVEKIVNTLHLEEQEAETTIRSLVEKDLIKLRLQCIVSLTQAGIDEVKAALNQPAPPAPPLAPTSAAEIAAQTEAIETLGAQLLGFLNAVPARPSAGHQPPPTRFVDASRDSEELAALELKNICEAIGLDPAEFTNERAVWDAFDEQRAANSLPEPVSNARAEMSFFQANDLPDILSSLKLRLLKVPLAPDDLAEAEAEIATAIAQLLSPRPKLPIIAASLKTLLSILEKAGTAALTSDIEMSLTRIRFFLTQLAV
jgi:hypothetical protein